MDTFTLRSYLQRVGVPLTGELSATLIAGGRSNLTFVLEDERSRWILRRPPTAGLTPSAHDVGREFRVIAALQKTGVPVAPTVHLCEDITVLGAPFSLVDYVEGMAVRTKSDIDRMTDRQIETCVEDMIQTLARLHAVDHQAAGLGGVGQPDGYLDRQVATWAAQWSRVKKQDYPDLQSLHAALAESVPAQSATAVVHGDYRIDNLLLDPDGAVRAVVDWEMATLGDPLADLALMCVYRDPALDLVMGSQAAWTSARLPSPSHLADRYAMEVGSGLPHWNFYLALANFKVAVIAQGIDHRYRVGATDVLAARAGEAVPDYIAAGLRAIRTEPA